MRRTRSIHLLFILLAAAIIFCFWIGFSFGKESQRQTDLIEISQAQLEGQSSGSLLDRNQDDYDQANTTTGGSTTKEENLGEGESTVEANSEYAQPQFYLKQTGEYVSVFVSATDELYFETDVLIINLPPELQEDMAYGLDFYSLENVYTFLENYSS